MSSKRSIRRRPVVKPSFRRVVSSAPFWIGLISVGFVTALLARAMMRNDEMIRNRTAAAAAVVGAADAAWDPSWPPLPTGKGQPAAPMAEVQAAYAFAARRPDVLDYIPCYCGCQAEGHRSNEQCYVRSRTPDGAPQWDAHAVT